MEWIDELLAKPYEQRELAETLRLVRLPADDVVPGPRRLWFTGRERYFDVFVDLRDGEIVWLQLSLRGFCMTWDPSNKRLQTDLTGELDAQAYGMPASRLLRGVRSAASSNFVRLALLVLEAGSVNEPLFADAAAQIRDGGLPLN